VGQKAPTQSQRRKLTGMFNAQESFFLRRSHAAEETFARPMAACGPLTTPRRCGTRILLGVPPTHKLDQDVEFHRSDRIE
jgi:hypothetical protein